MRAGLFCAALLANTTAAAQPLFYRASVATAWVVAFPQGEPTPLPPLMITTVSGGAALGGPFSWLLETGFGTPYTVFHPYPRVMLAASYKAARTVYSLAAIYQYHPPYDGKPAGHLFVVPVGLTVPVTPELGLTVGAGPGKLVSGPWSIAATVKLSLLL